MTTLVSISNHFLIRLVTNLNFFLFIALVDGASYMAGEQGVPRCKFASRRYRKTEQEQL